MKNYNGDDALNVSGRSDVIEKRELNHFEKQGLFGYLYAIYEANRDLFNECGIDFEYLYDNSMIQNNELRLMNGDGVALSDNLVFDSIYVNKYNCVIMSCYDKNGHEILFC